MIDVETFLTSKHITYVLHEHPPVYTCEEAHAHFGHVAGCSCKNLFLEGKKSGRLFLVVLPSEKRADLKKIASVVGEHKVTFANGETLRDVLGVEAGAVSPFGLLNDTQRRVEMYIDEEVYSAEKVRFHPNRNTASLEMSVTMFKRYLQEIENKVTIVALSATC